jgi:hypothetical protein
MHRKNFSETLSFFLALPQFGNALIKDHRHG